MRWEKREGGGGGEEMLTGVHNLDEFSAVTLEIFHCIWVIDGPLEEGNGDLVRIMEFGQKRSRVVIWWINETDGLLPFLIFFFLLIFLSAFIFTATCTRWSM